MDEAEVRAVAMSLEGDYVVIQKGEAGVKPGMIFVEAKLKDDAYGWDSAKIRDILEKQLSAASVSFDLGEDLLANEYKAILILGDLYQKTDYAIESLKVVEYVGPKTDVTCYSSNSVRVNIQVYQLHSGTPKEKNDDLPQGEITILPHINFDGRWDELVFDTDLKENLLRMMTNMLRFSRKPGGNAGEITPLILLHGPPGTGKTTLCQGLAQKISIRLNSDYEETKLIEIKTATLLSKYYSESAKQVDGIFTCIERICRERPDNFICVIIDEVESIANSRDSSAKHGEAQDSLRATNALLTGIDRAKACPNVIFLCTSNMFDCLDLAFVDRCGLKLTVNPPSSASQYAILRDRVQKLIDRGFIMSEITLPSHRDATIDVYNKDLPGSRLLRIIELISSVNSQTARGGGISGRRLARFPEEAILPRLIEDECGLEMALSFMETLVLEEQSQGEQSRRNSEMLDANRGTENTLKGIEIRGQKRKMKIILEEDCDMEVLETITKMVTKSSHGEKRRGMVKIKTEETE